jgi:IS30 family transposase
LSFAEREEISRGLAAGRSLRAIATKLGRAPSTISREVAAHGGPRRYRAAPADQQAWSQARRPQVCKLATRPALRAIVGEQLKQKWSPEQIAGWLKATYPHDPEMQVSHETIYRTLTQADFDATADQLNGRPRQTLGFKTPSQALAEVLR